MTKRTLESPTTGRGKRIKPVPEISTVVVARPVWRTGQQGVVTWSSQGEVPVVDIDLYRASADALGGLAFIKALVGKAGNSGSHEVLLPSGLTPGQHVVRIESRVNGAVFADSAKFTVKCTGGAPAISQVAVRQLIWHGGSRQQVTWSSQGEVPAVDIDLYRASADALGGLTLVKTLKHGANNSGSHEVLVPDGLTPGQHVVRIESRVNGAVFADSAEFTVVPTGAMPAISTVVVARPVWRTGQQGVVTWSSQGEVPAVDIDLYRASADALGGLAFIKALVGKASNSGSHEVLLPSGLTPGQHVVRIESRVNGAVFADSAKFTVKCTGGAPAISQVAVRQLIWHGGSRQQVTWSSQGEVPAVDIDLYRASADALGGLTLVKTLKHGANNSGSHEVLVPDGLTPGQHVVRIESKVNRHVLADSAEFTVDDEHRERCVRYALLLLGLPSACKLPYALIRKVAVAAAMD